MFLFYLICERRYTLSGILRREKIYNGKETVLLKQQF